MTAAAEVSPSAPVLVGVGIASQRIDDLAGALEPLELMETALRGAGRDSGRPEILSHVGQIAVPHGRWKYSDPAGELARRVGAEHTRTVLAEVGILQQTLITDACARIASGEMTAAVVVGGECGHRIKIASRAGQRVSETTLTGQPDVTLRPASELRADAELAAGPKSGDGYYAILESAFRARHGLTVAEHSRQIAAMYSGMSRVAARNRFAWRPVEATAEEIQTVTASNPMMAFPYSRSHIASWSVDQAGALLFCSAALARRLGVPEDRWVFPLASAESNHMVNVCNRRDLGRTEAVGVTVEAALRAAAMTSSDLTHLDLYSCFPVAVEMFAEALGIGILDRDLTITGGMPWAGGPFNNYVIQSTAQLALQLREAGGPATGMTTCVSGLLTKIGAAIWSTTPSAAFVNVDVSRVVAEACETVPVVPCHTGLGQVAGYTVLHGHRGRHGVLVLDIPGARSLAWTDDTKFLDSMEQDDWIGRDVDVLDGRLVP